MSRATPGNTGQLRGENDRGDNNILDAIMRLREVWEFVGDLEISVLVKGETFDRRARRKVNESKL